MKKNIILFAVISVLLAACGSQRAKDAYEIKGNIIGLENQMVYLQHLVADNLEVKDSVKSNNGTFSFEGKVDVPQQFVLTFGKIKQQIPFFVEPADIEIKGDIDSLQNLDILGSNTQEVFNQYGEGIGDLVKQQRQIYQEYQMAASQKDEAKMKQAEEKYMKVDSLKNIYNDNFIKENPNNVAAAFVAFTNSYTYDLEKLNEIVNSFDTAIHKSVYYQKINERLNKLKNTQVGKVAPNFTMKDVDGKAVSLKDFRGKYLLLDFWASWCGPCRKENPTVVKAYKKFHKKNFTVLGVSLDDNKDNWLKAIEKDNLTWTHLSDLKGWRNEASQLYGVMSIPQNFLLDKNGVIIAKDLRGEDLLDKLKEVLK